MDASAIFRAGFTACPTDPRTLIVDVRDKKQFDKGHISGAYCIRLPSSGNVLLGECQGSDDWLAKTPDDVPQHPATSPPPPPLLLPPPPLSTAEITKHPLPAADYSKGEYDLKWSADCWWNRDVIVMGEAGLKRDHPVLAFLARDKCVLRPALLCLPLPRCQRRHWGWQAPES